MVHLGGTALVMTARPEYRNLLLVLAYCVLDDALTALRKQGEFSCKGDDPSLGRQMDASRGNRLWQDYDLVNLGKVARNALAHEGEFASAADCDKYIDAIESELRAWDVL